MATMGGGLSEPLPKFKRRDIRSYGIDLRFNLVRHTLYIAICYKLVRADSDQILNNIILERDRFIGSRQRESSRVGKNIDVPYHATIKKDMEFTLGNVQYSVNKTYVSNDESVIFTVVESKDSRYCVGTEHSFNVSRVHSLILNIINTI